MNRAKDSWEDAERAAEQADGERVELRAQLEKMTQQSGKYRAQVIDLEKGLQQKLRLYESSVAERRVRNLYYSPFHAIEPTWKLHYSFSVSFTFCATHHIYIFTSFNPVMSSCCINRTPKINSTKRSGV